MKVFGTPPTPDPMEGQSRPPTLELLIKTRRRKEGAFHVVVITEDTVSRNYGAGLAGRFSWMVCKDELHSNYVSSHEHSEYILTGRWAKILLPTAAKGLLMP